LLRGCGVPPHLSSVIRKSSESLDHGAIKEN
jgi:hypothetical protein